MTISGNELKTLGRSIRRRRLQLGMSQDELAHRCGLHRTYVSDVEGGNRNISFFSLLSIARGLGMTVSELTAEVGGAAKGGEHGGGIGGLAGGVNMSTADCSP